MSAIQIDQCPPRSSVPRGSSSVTKECVARVQVAQAYRWVESDFNIISLKQSLTHFRRPAGSNDSGGEPEAADFSLTPRWPRSSESAEVVPDPGPNPDCIVCLSDGLFA
eukprot:COSAG02_NODE_15688_length_1148_cov_6.437560_1_plen_109_part_00